MRKLYLLFAALIGFSAVANAGVKNLYKQDFESVKTAAEAGWSSPNLPDGMTIKSTDEGSWFMFSLGNANNRNAILNWNPAEGTIFDGQDIKKYTVTFLWGHTSNPKGQNNGAATNDTQFSTEIAILSENAKITNNSQYGYYESPDSNRIFTITQLKGAWDKNNPDNNPYFTKDDVTTYANDFFINGDRDNKITLAEGAWYIITVTVDTEAKTTEYSVEEMGGSQEVLASGTYKLGENCSPWARGINVLLGRYSSVAEIDDVKVQQEMADDYANTPTVALTAVDMNKRTYQILFEDGEILKGKTTEGTDIDEVTSPFNYETTTSGTLTVWTVSGTATSEKVEVEVVAEPITLPNATAAITKVNDGYWKEYKLSVDNTTVPTMPQILMTYEFKGVSGKTITSPDEVLSGTTLVVEEEGTLTITTKAAGFLSSTSTIKNDSEFKIDKTLDFQHMTEAELTGLGFTEMDPIDSSTMSGENNWTARKRLWFGIENGETDDDGKPLYETHVVYGPSADGCEPIRRFYLGASKITEKLFEPLNLKVSATGDGSDVPSIKVNMGIGLIQTAAPGDDPANATVRSLETITLSIADLTEEDFYIVYKINDYGTSSKHPIYEVGTTKEDGIAKYKAENLGDGTMVEVHKGNETFDLYRIDTAIARITIFKNANPTNIKDVTNGVKNNADENAPIYDLRGVQQTKGALQKGVYIQNGKKFVNK